MPDQVPEETKGERIERLVEVVQRVAASRNTDRVGRVEEVLVEGPSRTDPSHPEGQDASEHHGQLPRHGPRGELAAVRIEGATSTTLRGTETALVAA